jgi:hypothetical protein
VLLLWLRGVAAVRFVMCAPSVTSSFSRVHWAEQPTRLQIGDSADRSSGTVTTCSPNGER